MAVLDPEWLSNVMTCVVTANIGSDNPVATLGQLRQADWKKVWASKHYPEAVHRILVDLLHALEIAYPARAQSGSGLQYSIVPAMLPKGVPAKLPTAAFGTATLCPGRAACIRLELDHVPLHFFPRLHARVQAVARPDDNSLWRTGGVFIESGKHSHRVLVWQPKPRALRNIIEVRTCSTTAVSPPPSPFCTCTLYLQCTTVQRTHS